MDLKELLKNVSGSMEAKLQEKLFKSMISSLAPQQQQPQQQQQQSYPPQRGMGRGQRRDVSQIQCFSCHNLGHYANTCPMKQPGAYQMVAPPPPMTPGGMQQQQLQQQQMVAMAPAMVTPQQTAQTTVVSAAELAAVARHTGLFRESHLR